LTLTDFSEGMVEEARARLGDVGAFRVADVHDLLFANGAGQLEPFFGEIQVERYPDALEITEVEALAAYGIRSGRLTTMSRTSSRRPKRRSHATAAFT
jgi:hypothetical protein